MMETAIAGHDSSSPSADNKRNLKINVSQSGDSIKLKITNHDGAAKVVSNHHSSSSSSHNHHAPKNKDSTDHAKKDPNKKPSHENGTVVTKHKDKSHSSSHKSSSKTPGSGSAVKVSSKHKDNASNHVSSKSETSSSSKPNDQSVTVAKEHKHLSNNVSKIAKTGNDDFKSKSDKTVTVAKHKDKDGSSKSAKQKDGASTKTSHGVKSKEDGVSSSSKKHKELKDGNSNDEKTKNAEVKVAVKTEKPDCDSSSAKTSETKEKNDGVVKVKTEGDKTKDKSKHKNKENHDKKEKHKHNDVKVEANEKHKQIKDSKSSTHDKVKDKSSSSNTSTVKPSKDGDFKSEGGHVKLKLKPVNDSISEDKHTPVKVKSEQTSDDDVPLSARKESKSVEKSAHKKAVKRILEDSEDDEPLVVRAKKKVKSEHVETKKRKSSERSESPVAKKKKVTKTTAPASTTSPKKKKKEEETQEVWKWWEEEKRDDKVKWKTLQHKGPILAPDYEPLPKNVQFKYNGKVVELTQDTEELATFYAKLLDHDYTSKEAFNTNFFKDWRKVMTPEEKELIKDLKKCDFTQINKYFLEKTEAKKAMTKEEKAVIKKQNEDLIKEYGFCIIDGHKEKIGNFKIEPPGLFRGRGEHPKMGRHKKRIMPRDVIINCSKGSEVPKPPAGHKWKEVRHDNSVTWLACWTENIQGQTKYVMLNPSSKLKGEKDWQKYEVARKLKSCVDKIRANYRNEWKHKEMKVRQRAVALYFIDQLALRAGNEKEEGETADTVGCCSLRVEHITLHDHKDGKQYVVNFDFLGKDSIRYENSVPVEKRVYKNLQIFMENKQPGDDLFDRLNTAVLNKHLNELMDGLTAKVFRTYNASKTLQEQLSLLTKADDSPAAKLLSYNRANRAVAILCNHQRSVPKTFNKSMENLQGKIKAKEEAIEECEDELRSAKKDYKNGRNNKDKSVVDRKSKQLERLKDQLSKLEIQATDREENKQIALGTSKLNYLDPRITVAWCKKWEVPIEKVYNRTQRDKFRWAIEMAGPDFVF